MDDRKLLNKGKQAAKKTTLYKHWVRYVMILRAARDITDN